MKKRISCLALAVLLTLGGALSAHADDLTKIDKVSVTVSCSPKPAAGDEVGNVTVTTESKEFTIDIAEFTTDNDTWVLGDEPMVLVELSANDGYRFSYTSKSHFSISGDGAEFEKAKIYDSGSWMELTISLDQIKGRLDAPEYLDWNGTIAQWDPMDGAKSYEVRLYRNGRTVTTVKTQNTYYDFSGQFTQEGDYSFKVRGVAEYNDRAGDWSESSDDQTIEKDALQYISGSGRWILDSNGWWYMYANGGYPNDGFRQIDNAWYYFNPNGYIQLQWGFINGHWYYFGSNGVMTTGWQLVNGIWYYLGPDGIMATGWQYINGKWYYLDSSGAMYANTYTPDGHFVDASGARVW